MKKRILAMIMAASMAAIAVAGCGSSSGSGSSATAETEAAAEAPAEGAPAGEAPAEGGPAGEAPAEGGPAGEAPAGGAPEGGAPAGGAAGPYRIAMIQQHQTNAFQITVTEAAKDEAEKLGVELEIFDANQDAATQISQIEQCVAQGYDAILFEPVDPDGLTSAAKAASDAGVVVINVISACTDWQDNGISAISLGDNTTAGELEMQNVADLLGGAGQIAIITGPSGDSGGLARYQGYMNILENYPDIELVVEADCAWDTASAQSTVESWLVAFELDAIVSENDGMAVGAGNAAGADSGIIITGVDATPDGLEAISSGLITATVNQDAASMARNGLNAAVALLNGETLEETDIRTQNIWVDSSNVADYM